MTQLVFVEKEKVITDSLVIAEMFGKRHDIVLRDIRTQIEYAGEKFSLHNFEESTYKIRGKAYPKYNLTEEAFTLVVMSYNTKEAVQSKIKFIQEFRRMREHIEHQQKPLSPAELALLQAQNMVALEKKVHEQDNRIDKIETDQQNLTEIIGLSVVEWRKKVTNILNRIAKNNGGFQMYQEIRKESYKLLEERAKCKLSIRVTNKQKVMALNGVPKSTINKVSKLDAISEDARLTEIYLAIVKELAIKYRVSITDLVVI